MLLVGAAWFASPYLRAQVHRSLSDFHTYVSKNEVSSTALHIEFVRKSLAIVEEAPVIGHGTGSITEEFRRAMAGETGAAGYVTENPHNQIFGVAIQLGVVGAALLIAMWVAHLMLFCGGGLTGYGSACSLWFRTSSLRLPIRICSTSAMAGSMYLASAL